VVPVGVAVGVAETPVPAPIRIHTGGVVPKADFERAMRDAMRAVRTGVQTYDPRKDEVRQIFHTLTDEDGSRRVTHVETRIRQTLDA
jgi:hypothetical protein